MTKQELIKKYPGKSIPEFVTLTMLAIKDDRMVGCEAPKGFSYCASCVIGKHCYMRMMFVFQGGAL